jgi:hypothetical protein
MSAAHPSFLGPESRNSREPFEVPHPAESRRQEKLMAVVPLSQAASNVSEIRVSSADSRRFLRMTAAGALVAGGALLIAGKRRPGLVMALGGAALVAIEQREAIGAFWTGLPRYLGAAQSVLGRAQAAVEDLNAQCEKLRHVLGK